MYSVDGTILQPPQLLLSSSAKSRYHEDANVEIGTFGNHVCRDVVHIGRQFVTKPLPYSVDHQVKAIPHSSELVENLAGNPKPNLAVKTTMGFL